MINIIKSNKIIIFINLVILLFCIGCSKEDQKVKNDKKNVITTETTEDTATQDILTEDISSKEETQADREDEITQSSVVGATIWPITKIKVRKYPDVNSQQVDLLETGIPKKIIEVQEDFFKVAINDRTGWISSEYCLINLPDILPELEYDITNAYCAVYKCHDIDINGITGQVLYQGAGKTYNDKIGREEYLVPLIYPAALKLTEAQRLAEMKGYNIKIYDSYRPKSVSKQMYESLSNDVESKNLSQYLNGEVNGYYYSQSWFLAKETSAHNYGVAIDMTLVKNGMDIITQTPVDQLCICSVIDNNTDDANLMQEIMTEAGFTNLKSEWWHFQDNEATVFKEKIAADFQVYKD